MTSNVTPAQTFHCFFCFCLLFQSLNEPQSKSVPRSATLKSDMQYVAKDEEQEAQCVDDKAQRTPSPRLVLSGALEKADHIRTEHFILIFSSSEMYLRPCYNLVGLITS